MGGYINAKVKNDRAAAQGKGTGWRGCQSDGGGGSTYRRAGWTVCRDSGELVLEVSPG